MGYVPNLEEMMRFLVVAAAILTTLLSIGCEPKPLTVSEWGTTGYPDGLWPHEKSPLAPNPDALFGRLENGMRYVIQRNAKPEGRVSVHLNVQAGSLMEQDHELGLAHFLEHMAFNGSRNFPPGTLIPFFQKNGMAFGRDANAHTSFRETVYKLNLAEASDENLRTGLLIMRDVADGMSILPEEVDKERGVVLSEKAARDSKEHRAASRMRDILFQGTRFANEPIGEEAIIRNASAETIRGFYEAWYRPELMVLVVVGEIEPRSVEKRIIELFSDMTPRTPKPALPEWGEVRHQGLTAYADIYDTEQTIVRIRGMKPRKWDDDSEAVQRRMILEAMASSMISNRLARIREKNSGPYIKAGTSARESFNMFPYVTMSAICEGDRWRESLSVLQTELTRALEHGFLQEELDEVRTQYLRFYERQVEREADTPNENVAAMIIGCMNANRVYQNWTQTAELFTRFLNQATPEEVHKAFVSAWDTGNRIVAVTGNADIPGNNASEEVRLAWEAGQDAETAAPEKRKSVAYPYVEEPAERGNAVSRENRQLEGSDLVLREVTFANGLKLRMLPTDFATDYLAVTLHIGNGLNAVEDERFILAQVAGMANANSGFGRLAREEARRVKARKGYSVGLSVGMESFIISGSGRPKDSEAVLRAMWTEFRDPSFGQRDLDFALETLRLNDAGRRRDVPSTLGDEMRSFLFGEGLRNTPITESDANNLNLQDLQMFIRWACTRGNPVMNVVGDFNPEEFEKLAARFFGADSLKWGETAPADHIFIPDFPEGGNRIVTMDTGIGQAGVVTAFQRDLADPYDRKALATRRLLAAVLRDRLREHVREKLGASYSPSARYRVGDLTGYGLYIIKIGTQPDKVSILREAVDKTVAGLTEGNITPEELNKMRKPMLTGLKRMLDSNSTWMNLLNRTARRDLPYFAWMAQTSDVLESITAEDLNREAAEAFTTNKRAVLVVTESPAVAEAK